MNQYVPPKVWTWDKENGGAFASTNRPIAGATHDKELPRGEHPIQLYSLATPNGQKVTIMLEELLAAGHDAEYDAYLINIGKGDQFGSGFVSINPNSKIPAMMDYGPKEPIRLFESASMMLYLADKFDAFLSKDVAKRAETMNWLFWQMGSAPFVGGGFGHFYAYPINRYAMETKRQLDVLDRQLAEHEYVSGSDYTIADMAIFPWYGGLVLGRAYNAAEFLDVGTYKNVMRWAKQVDAREPVKRGRCVNAAGGPEDEHLHERHSAADIDKVLAVRKARGTV
jgi:GSH-dependent disulfide-bond oxidoreductase